MKLKLTMLVIPDDKNSHIIFIIPRDDPLLIGTIETDYREYLMVGSMWFKHFLTSGGLFSEQGSIFNPCREDISLFAN